jgi:hypothetical protein
MVSIWEHMVDHFQQKGKRDEKCKEFGIEIR